MAVWDVIDGAAYINLAATNIDEWPKTIIDNIIKITRVREPAMRYTMGGLTVELPGSLFIDIIENDGSITRVCKSTEECDQWLPGT
jgi:hypothetical protein